MYPCGCITHTRAAARIMDDQKFAKEELSSSPSMLYTEQHSTRVWNNVAPAVNH